MKRILLFCCTILLSVAIHAQDFASRFMTEHKEDARLKCISISPKMMEEVLKIDVADGEDVLDIISNLKSMQMISSESEGAKYYQTALSILEKNTNRFEPYLDFNDHAQYYRIMVRKKNKTILELVMLMKEDNRFVVINFTGNMSDRFIEKVAKSMKMNPAQ